MLMWNGGAVTLGGKGGATRGAVIRVYNDEGAGRKIASIQSSNSIAGHLN